MMMCEHPDGCPRPARVRYHGQVAYCTLHLYRAYRNDGDPGPLAELHGPRRMVRPPRLDGSQRSRIADLYRDESYSVQEIADMSGCSVTTVRCVVRKMLSPEERRNATERRAWVRRKYRYRPDLFVAPLSDDELWLFGLLMADGTTDGRGEIRLGLSVRDRDAIESARRVAESDAPIVVVERSGGPSRIRGGPAASWAMHSRDLVARVAALGMVRAKSYREDVHVPEAVAQSPSFWRGLIDGDGTIRRDGTRPQLILLAGRPLLEQWASFAVESIGGPPPGIRRQRSGRILHRSSLSGVRAWDMLSILYGQGGPAMERKRKTALELLSAQRPSPTRIPIELVELALGELPSLPLGSVPQKYVCPRTGVRLGRMLHDARLGGRRHLHDLFSRHDPQWRVAGASRSSPTLESVRDIADRLARDHPVSLLKHGPIEPLRNYSQQSTRNGSRSQAPMAPTPSGTRCGHPEGCPEPAQSSYHGVPYCKLHWGRARNNGGDPGPVERLEAQKGSGHVMPNGFRRMTINGRRVGEHRVVAAQMLGRPLRRGERVYHRNDIRSDNRPENLEIRVAGHLYGQGVDDVAAWLARDHPSEFIRAWRKASRSLA